MFQNRKPMYDLIVGQWYMSTALGGRLVRVIDKKNSKYLLDYGIGDPVWKFVYRDYAEKWNDTFYYELTLEEKEKYWTNIVSGKMRED